MEPLNIPNKIRVIINEIHIMRIRNMTTKENNNNKKGAKLEVFFKLGARTRKRTYIHTYIRTYDLKYSLASLIKIVDEDGKKNKTNRQKQTKRSSGGIK